jgi:hypothetical protein
VWWIAVSICRRDEVSHSVIAGATVAIAAEPRQSIDPRPQYSAKMGKFDRVQSILRIRAPSRIAGKAPIPPDAKYLAPAMRVCYSYRNELLTISTI